MRSIRKYGPKTWTVPRLDNDGCSAVLYSGKLQRRRGLPSFQVTKRSTSFRRRGSRVTPKSRQFSQIRRAEPIEFAKRNIYCTTVRWAGPQTRRKRKKTIINSKKKKRRGTRTTAAQQWNDARPRWANSYRFSIWPNDARGKPRVAARTQWAGVAELRV